jgi:hypothetical protein
MSEEAETPIAAELAKSMALICVRNRRLEDLHAGRVPFTKAAHGSDVFLVDAGGDRILWTEVSRIDDDEMRDPMRDIVNRLHVSLVFRRLEAAGRDREVDSHSREMGSARSQSAHAEAITTFFSFRLRSADELPHELFEPVGVSRSFADLIILQSDRFVREIENHAKANTPKGWLCDSRCLGSRYHITP